MASSLTMIGISHLMYFMTAEDHEEVGTFLRKDSYYAIYQPFALNFRLIAATILLLCYHTDNNSNSIVPQILLVLLQTGYMLFLILSQPYILKFDFFRSMCV